MGILDFFAEGGERYIKETKPLKNKYFLVFGKSIDAIGMATVYMNSISRQIAL